jgi:hypothetical protein
VNRPRRFAQQTKVPISKSKAEIEELLRKNGASGFVSGWDDETGEQRIMCKINGRMLRFKVDPVDREDEQFAYTETGRARNEDAILAAYEGEERRRWRALLLIIKAKLEVIASGLSTFEKEFLADIVLPEGETVGEWMEPQIEQAYLTGTMPPLLPPAKKRR